MIGKVLKDFVNFTMPFWGVVIGIAGILLMFLVPTPNGITAIVGIALVALGALESSQHLIAGWIYMRFFI